MAGPPTFSLRPTFLAFAMEASQARFVIAGIPLDIGASNRAGARFGPAAVRQASRMLVDGANPSGWADPPTMPIADLGEFEIQLGDIVESLKLIQRQAEVCRHLIAIGGDHTITLALLRALKARRGEPVGLVHFDAHVDTWPDCFGAVYSHGSVMYHAIQEGLVDPTRMIQVGIRSPVQKEVWDWTLEAGVTILSAEDVHLQGPESVASRIRQVVGASPCYLSFDIDAIDPSQAPGTGTPEIGGLFTWQILALLRRLRGLDFIGMDVVEVLPAHDVAEITALAAATVIWQYLSLLDG